MPTYDYRCKACAYEFELVQSMSAPVKKKCPECGKLQLGRLIGVGAGFFVKGKASPPPTKAASKAPAPEAPAKDATADSPKADTAPKDQPKSESAEKRISGGTSTPTHVAREGRGVGNLVDKAKRIAKSKPSSDTPKK
ncbi:MAG: hypothetical protein MK074_08410 [Phycisphaerales bacterium]|nr:hypothetical protein [Phycisphaerales bacterium]